MRKRIINQNDSKQNEQGSINIANVAQVEITSENPAFPIESALTLEDSIGWKASHPGKQTIRVLFDEPQRIQRIRLQFDEQSQKRTHEFVLRWSAEDGQPCKEIIRQQYTFSPPSTIQEVEDYVVNLTQVKVLELQIVPDIGDSEVLASLTHLQII